MLLEYKYNYNYNTKLYTYTTAGSVKASLKQNG